MSLDLSIERAAVKSRLATITELSGNFSTALPAGFTPTLDAYGRMSPYVVRRYGRPVPLGDRTLDDDEDQYPHTWPVGISLYAIDGDAADLLADKIDAKIRGWAPSENNSTQFRGGPSYSYPRSSSDNIPARIEVLMFYTCIVNMQRA